jgi:hypothetical protein
MATATLEDVAAASRDPATLFFQLYVLRDRDFTRELVQVSSKHCAAYVRCKHVPMLWRHISSPDLRSVKCTVWCMQRAEKAGYAALAVTVDAPRYQASSCKTVHVSDSTYSCNLCALRCSGPGAHSLTPTLAGLGGRCKEQVRVISYGACVTVLTALAKDFSDGDASKRRFLLPDGLKLANLEHSSLQLPVYREHQDAEGSGIAQVQHGCQKPMLCDVVRATATDRLSVSVAGTTIDAIAHGLAFC